MTGAFPPDRWYPVGSSAGLLPGMARAVSLCGRDIACWRGQSGRVHAWNNRCVHRGMRLSFGFVRGDRLVCRYHGWNYDEAGACCAVPARPQMKPSDKIAVPRHGAVDRDGLLWVRLDGADDSPPDLASIGTFAFAQSIVLPRAAETLARCLRRVIFPPAALAGEGREPQAWHATIESQDDEITTVRWSLGDQEGHLARYRRHEPRAGLFAITAESPDLARETRLLALQPQNEVRSALHIMVAGEGADSNPPCRSAAHWGRRLAWFVENEGGDTVSYNPWISEAGVP